MLRKLGIAAVALGGLSGGAAFAQAQLQCYSADPHYLIQTQPIHTGAPPQYVQSSYRGGSWSEHESMAMKAKWTEMARIPSQQQLASAQPAGTWYVPASPVPGQPPQAYVPVQAQGRPQPLPQQPAPQPAMPQQQAMAPPGQAVAAQPLPPPADGAAPATKADATEAPGAVGCQGERIDSTTAAAARRAFEAVGFQGVSDLRKGCDNVWHAHAKLNNRATYVMLNPQGDIYIEKNP